MRTTLAPEDFQSSVVAVPPLCRTADLRVDPVENQRLVRHLEGGGIRLLLYGGNANFYNIALGEYDAVLDALESSAGPDTVVVPSVGPYFGTMMDQAALLARRNFPTAMILPTVAVSSPEGVRVAVMKFVERFGRPAVLYIKDEKYVTVGVAKALAEAGALSWIKYAVVRPDPSQDDLLRALCDAVDPRMIVSGIGEQPAIAHRTRFGLGGFTSGCVCVAPRLSMDLLAALNAGDLARAESIRATFLALETLRNTHGPIPVLHHAVALAGVAQTGPVLPLLAPLPAEIAAAIGPVARALLETEKARRQSA